MLQYLIVSTENGPPGSKREVNFTPFTTCQRHCIYGWRTKTQRRHLLFCQRIFGGMDHSTLIGEPAQTKKRTPYWLPVLLPAVQHPLPSKPLNSLQTTLHPPSK